MSANSVVLVGCFCFEFLVGLVGVFFLGGGVVGLSDGRVCFLISKKEKEEKKLLHFFQSWLKCFLHIGTDYKCVCYATHRMPFQNCFKPYRLSYQTGSASLNVLTPQK